MRIELTYPVWKTGIITTILIAQIFVELDEIESSPPDFQSGVRTSYTKVPFMDTKVPLFGWGSEDRTHMQPITLSTPYESEEIYPSFSSHRGTCTHYLILIRYVLLLLKLRDYSAWYSQQDSNL